jgi:hypothetical protein
MKLTDEQAANAYRLRQAEKILQIFKTDQGRQVESMEELELWAGTARGQAALARHRNGKIVPVPYKSR